MAPWMMPVKYSVQRQPSEVSETNAAETMGPTWCVRGHTLCGLGKDEIVPKHGPPTTAMA